MSSQLTEQILRLHRRFTLQPTQDSFSFWFIVDQNNLDFLTHCQQEGLLIEEMKYNNCYFDPAEINQYCGKQVEELSDPEIITGLNQIAYGSWHRFLSQRCNITNTPVRFLILEDHSIYPAEPPVRYCNTIWRSRNLVSY